MAITAEQVSSLRKRTGVGLLAVKSALEESGGDEEKAIDILRKRGIAQAIKKSDRDQKEGSIFIEAGSGKAGIVHMACETDFVARGDDFVNAGKELAKMALAKGVETVKAHAESIIPALVNKLGENVSLTSVQMIEGSPIGTYVHSNSKIGVIVTLDGGDEVKARDVAMHAAAMAPTVVNPEEVSSESVEKEKEIWRDQLKKEGKPEAMFDKIMLGKEKKFREESALMKQPFAKDQSMSVEKYLGGAKVMKYVRLSVS
ncbi:MAG TPA: translation elongation factor Ts [Candidatus Peribacterales bacterium]|nr:translation elongation factor Ts [Candidatus Peribacterales bacterium]